MYEHDDVQTFHKENPMVSSSDNTRGPRKSFTDKVSALVKSKSSYEDLGSQSAI